MAKKESIQKRLQKVRPPRVQLTCEVERGDAIEIKESSKQLASVLEAAALAERERLIAPVRLRNALQQLTRTWAHHGEHGVLAGDVDQRAVFVVRNRFFDGVEIARGLRGAGDKQVLIVGEAREREIRFVGAALVEHAGVDRGAGRHRYIVGDDALQHAFRIASFDEKFGERRHVE